MDESWKDKISRGFQVLIKERNNDNLLDQCARERVIISLLSRIFAIPWWLANWKLWPFIIGPRGGGQERKGMRNKIVHAHNERSSPLKERCLCHN